MQITAIKDERGQKYVIANPEAGTPGGGHWACRTTFPRLWAFSFGPYGGANVLVWGAPDIGEEGALEEAAEIVAKRWPGLIMEAGGEEHAELIREACEERGVAFTSMRELDWDDEKVQDARDDAEADLTYTESGYLASWEWTMDDVDASSVLFCRAIMAAAFEYDHLGRDRDE
jgi:hypothetical protein